jgi:DNA-binding transcriptional LysR family regulator
MNPERLRTLVAIADHAGFAAAAARLNRTPAAVSQQMKTLEDEFGVDLFDRSTRPPRLNAHGRHLAERARVLLSDIDAFLAEARNPGEVAGTLMMGCISGVSSDLLPRALAGLKARHPRITVRMVEGISTDLAQQVIHRRLDAAVITRPLDPEPALRMLPIVDEPMVLVLPASAPETRWEDAVRAHPFLATHRRSGMGLWVADLFRRAGLVLNEAMELDSSEAIVGLARAGLGVGAVPIGRLALGGRKPPRAGAPIVVDGLKVMAIGDPPLSRKLVIVERTTSKRQDLSHLLYEEIRALL